jgi:hypothetical protein
MAPGRPEELTCTPFPEEPLIGYQSIGLHALIDRTRRNEVQLG